VTIEARARLAGLEGIAREGWAGTARRFTDTEGR